MWEPKNFCCCGVRQGSVMIAVSVLVTCIIDISLMVLGLPTTVFEHEPLQGCRERDQMFMDEELCQKIAARHEMEKSVVISVRSVTDLVLIIVSSLLIHGVRKDKPCLLVPFMVLQIIGIISLTVVSITRMVSFAYEDTSKFMIALVLGPCAVFFMMYLFLVIRSCYIETKRSKTQSYTEFHDEVAISVAVD